MPNAIHGFFGEYRWLSNFWYARINLWGHHFPTTEHAYQWAKMADPFGQMMILLAATPGAAKREATKHVHRPGWHQGESLRVMFDVNYAKYTQHADLRAKLLATGDQDLVEENHWGDTYWGVCAGVGQNHLGLTLMAVRHRLALGVPPGA